MNREKLYKQFENTDNKRSVYDKLSGPGLLRKFKRALLLKAKYVTYISARLGLIKKDKMVTLFWGKDITLPISDSDAAKLYFFGALGKEESNLTKYLINNLNEDSVFYDIGANHGFYTLLASEIMTDGEVHAFEPSPAIYEYLKQASQASNVKINKSAVSNIDGKVDLFDCTSVGSSGKSTISLDTAEHLKKKSKKIPVDSIKLDSYINNNHLPTFIKIDVEGAESFVIKGAENLLTKHSPTIGMEVWGGDRGKAISSRAVKYLLELGYRPHSITNDGSLEYMSSVDYRRFLNIIFKKL